MEKYSFLNFSDYEKNYYDSLYDICRQGGQVEGKKAVDFFKLSNLSPVSYIIYYVCSLFWGRFGTTQVFSREPFWQKRSFRYIWNSHLWLSQVILFQIMVILGYSITIESLRSNHQKVELPRFQGIPVPPPPIQTKRSLNPFDVE